MIKKNTIRVLIVFVLFSLFVFGLTSSATADLAASEASLNPLGYVYEINSDNQGMLWITDYSAGEVWGVNPGTGAYQIFPVSGAPSDARQVNGSLFWADGLTNILGRVSTSAPYAYTHWQVPGSTGFLGTNLDSDGRLYATDNVHPYLYRLDPASNELCTFSLPVESSSIYIVRDDDYLWIGNGYDSTLFRLRITDNNLSFWTLPAGSFMYGMAVDGQGNLWYADDGLNTISMLNPNSNQGKSYSVPLGDSLNMLAIQSGMLWYTEQDLASVGRLDPLSAAYTEFTASVVSQTLNPSCITASSTSGTLTVESGVLSWTDASYPTLLNNGGWRIYQMPPDSVPWGITVLGTSYMVDQGRQVLSRFSTPQIYLPIALK